MPRAPHAPEEGFVDAPNDPTNADVQPRDSDSSIYVPVGKPEKKVVGPEVRFTGVSEPTSQFTVSTTGQSATATTATYLQADAEAKHREAKNRKREERHKARQKRVRRKPKPEYVERDGFDISDKVVWGTLASFVTAGFLGFIETTYGLPAPAGADVFLSGALVAVAGSVVAYFKRDRV